MAIEKFFAEFTDDIFTTSTEAILSSIDSEDSYTEILRIAVTELGTLAGPDHDQQDIVDGLSDRVAELAAEAGLLVTDSDSGSDGELYWTVAAMLPIDVAAAKHQHAAKAEAKARAELYEAVREQIRQGMPLSHVAARAGITRVTVDRVLGK